MDEKKAAEIIKRLNHFDRITQDPLIQTELRLAIYEYKEAKGFIEGRKAGLKMASEIASKWAEVHNVPNLSQSLFNHGAWQSAIHIKSQIDTELYRLDGGK